MKDFNKKYLKYKKKYLELKNNNQIGGNFNVFAEEYPNTDHPGSICWFNTFLQTAFRLVPNYDIDDNLVDKIKEEIRYLQKNTQLLDRLYWILYNFYKIKSSQNSQLSSLKNKQKLDTNDLNYTSNPTICYNIIGKNINNNQLASLPYEDPFDLYNSIYWKKIVTNYLFIRCPFKDDLNNIDILKNYYFIIENIIQFITYHSIRTIKFNYPKSVNFFLDILNRSYKNISDIDNIYKETIVDIFGYFPLRNNYTGIYYEICKIPQIKKFIDDFYKDINNNTDLNELYKQYDSRLKNLNLQLNNIPNDFNISKFYYNFTLEFGTNKINKNTIPKEINIKNFEYVLSSINIYNLNHYYTINRIYKKDKEIWKIYDDLKSNIKDTTFDSIIKTTEQIRFLTYTRKDIFENGYPINDPNIVIDIKPTNIIDLICNILQN